MRRRSRNRNALDIEVLFEREREGLLSFLVRRTAEVEVALDLWAETFAQALASRARFNGSTEAEATAWLYRIASHQLAHYYRRGRVRQRALARLSREPPQASESARAEIERRAGLDVLRGELTAALAELSEPTRRAVQLRVVDELSYPEVAVALQISVRAARARVARGLAAMANSIDEKKIAEAMST